MNKLWFRYPIRMMWLSMGYCPLCNSSPPIDTCPVCMGSWLYGPGLVGARKALWALHFRWWHEERKHNL